MGTRHMSNYTQVNQTDKESNRQIKGIVNLSTNPSNLHYVIVRIENEETKGQS